MKFQYASHDGDDTALLSLREDLIPVAGSCIRDTSNLLYYSDQLNSNGSVAESLRHITVALNLIGTGLRDRDDSSGVATFRQQ